MVSGTLSLPSRGNFHHSLTVLIHYRSTGSIQAYQMVLADSHTIPRAACYSRTHHRPAVRITTTGLTPSTVTVSTVFAYTPTPQPRGPVDPLRVVSQPQQRNPHRVSHAAGLAPYAFARHYSRNHYLFSLPVGTEMFHFPTFLPDRLYIQRPVTHHNSMPGSPIRTSWHQRSVINSTRLIADSHVLHQLLLPRHPPCALKHLRTQQNTTRQK